MSFRFLGKEKSLQLACFIVIRELQKSTEKDFDELGICSRLQDSTLTTKFFRPASLGNVISVLHHPPPSSSQKITTHNSIEAISKVGHFRAVVV